MSEIEVLLNSDKLSADKISHALSEIGYGNMLNGTKKMYDAGNAEGLAKGRRQGGLAVIVYPAPKTAAARGLNRTLAAHLTAHGLPDIISTAHIV